MAMRRGPRELPPLGAAPTERDHEWWDSLVEGSSLVGIEPAGLEYREGSVAAAFELAWLRLADHLGDVTTDDQMRERVCAVADREARLAAARRRVAAVRLEAPSASLDRRGA
jgi:hypothetical protein